MFGGNEHPWIPASYFDIHHGHQCCLSNVISKPRWLYPMDLIFFWFVGDQMPTCWGLISINVGCYVSEMDQWAGILISLLVICLCMSMLENKYQVMICIDHYSIIIHPIYKGLVRLQSATVPCSPTLDVRHVQGSYGTVYGASCLTTGRRVAIKRSHGGTKWHHNTMDCINWAKKWIENVQIKFVYNVFSGEQLPPLKTLLMLWGLLRFHS